MDVTAANRHGPVKLYGCPHGCSLVSHLALEYVGAPFEFKFINVLEREQFKPEYLALSPRGKVPLLISGAERVLENVAVLVWIAGHYPEAGLMPRRDEVGFVSAVSDLSWCASGVHPMMSRLIRPELFIEDGEGRSGVQAVARGTLEKEFRIIQSKVAMREVSPVSCDALNFYAFWIWARVGEADFDLGQFPGYAAFVDRMTELPFVRRVLDRERSYLPCFEHLSY